MEFFRETYAGILITLAILAAPVVAQVGQDVFQDVIEVRVVNLEVVVTDKDGERVTGLGPEDFTVTVDGRAVPVEYFSEIRGGEAQRSGAGSVGAPAQDRIEGTSYLVFIDEVFPLGRDRDLALDHVIEGLAALGRGDRMAVIAFDGKKIEMLADWTRSPDALRRVFESAKERTAHGLEEMALARTSGGMPWRAVAHAHRERIERVTLAATATLRSFANPPGRKVMLVLSGGWPVGYTDTFAVSPTLASLPDSLGYRDLYRPLSDTANRLGFTLYTMDMKIFNFSAGVSAEHRTSAEARAAFERSFVRDEAENATLLRLARETGGLAFLNQKGGDAFTAMVADTRSYYSLGFTPDWKGDDRRHAVKVGLRRPGLSARARRSFSDLSRRTEVTMMVESALIFDKAPAPGSLVVRTNEAGADGRTLRRMLVGLEIEIPLDGLTFLPRDGSWHTELELRVAAEDGQGHRNEISVVPVVLAFPQRPPAGRHAVYETAVRLRKKEHVLVVSLFDPISGQLWWTRLNVAP